MPGSFIAVATEYSDSKVTMTENRLEEIAEVFAVAVGGFSVMVNHFQLLLLDPDVAREYADEQFVGRWRRLFPPRDKLRQPTPVNEHLVRWRLTDALWVATARQRLQSLIRFMKCLKEPLSRLANRQDKTRGTFLYVRQEGTCRQMITIRTAPGAHARMPRSDKDRIGRTVPNARPCRGTQSDKVLKKHLCRTKPIAHYHRNTMTIDDTP